MRGNLQEKLETAGNVRAIPAGAGEPTPAPEGDADKEGYPRGCGGTEQEAADAWAVRGLSPRVRGNPGKVWVGGVIRRAIPAGAGEP